MNANPAGRRGLREQSSDTKTRPTGLRALRARLPEMNADPSGLRAASRSLALRFAALIVALFLVVAGVVIALVASSEHQALTQQLLSAERLDSPNDVPPGVYVAISSGPGGRQPQNGQGDADGQTGQGGPNTQGGQSELAVTANAPSGFPDSSALNQVAQGGPAIQRTMTLDGDSFIVRTDGDSGRVVQVAVDKSESQAELRRVILALAFSGIAAIAGAVLAAWWMSRRAMRPLAEALALQRRFVADAGHELRTPLTLLSTRAQMLRRSLPGPAPSTPASPASLPAPASTPVPAGSAASTSAASPDPVRDGLDEIVADAKALTGILEDLLVSADPRQDAERAPVELAALADEVAAATRAEAANRGIAIDRHGIRPATVSGVRVSLSRLILALLSNALDHARSRVAVTVSLHGREVWLEVADDGPGFPQGTAERAFERFASNRDADPESTGSRHYGLGLALVAEVAHRHGGTVAIVDTGGRGALVRVSLPAIAPA